MDKKSQVFDDYRISDQYNLNLIFDWSMLNRKEFRVNTSAEADLIYIPSCGDREKGIEAFCSQSDGEGWMLPETLRLADYGLGHDERAKEHQPVSSRLGSRFYDWQLEQNAEESWRECHLHARNLLGESGYRKLLDEIDAEKGGVSAQPATPSDVSAPVAVAAPEEPQRQGKLFD